jgi:NAD(P)-dependent dehydrogenase (short-subunit alcohol dehydrogenase family)
MQLENKIMLVTGGASGIGQAAALRCSREGAKVVIMDIDETKGVETEAKIRLDENECLFIKSDVRNEKDWIRVMEMIENKYNRLDLLFNNAGTNLVKAITETSEKEFDSIINLNLKGVFLGMKHAIPLMIKGGGGNIVNNASIFGLVANPGMPVYSASKAGIIALTRQVALDYASKNIRVNCICPGSTLTPRLERYLEQGIVTSEGSLGPVPMARWAKPDEIASVVLFLLSDEASYMTGSATVVDGGWTAH